MVQISGWVTDSHLWTSNGGHMAPGLPVVRCHEKRGLFPLTSPPAALRDGFHCLHTGEGPEARGEATSPRP